MDDYKPLDTEEPGEVVLTLQQILESENIAELLDQHELDEIGQDAVDDYKLDKQSMKAWLDQMKDGIELAKLTKSEKTYPFKMAANVKYPLVTTAALQFNARAYPAIVASDGIVKAKVHGSDPQGLKAARGDRVAAHMSWQLMSKIEEWEEETDKLLVQLPIVGTMVRKVWYDPTVQRPRCRVITPGAFIVNDKIKALGEAPRMTEEISLYPSEIESRKRAGTFRKVEFSEADGEDRMKPEDFIEQHTRLDLDEDDYDEPYIVTVHVPTGKVARIVADFEESSVIYGEPDPEQMMMVQQAAMMGVQMPMPQGEVISITRGSYFVPYHFLPSMDGGFFGTGLGILLGDISKTVNSIINMMMDAGHMASLGGGFIGSDMRIKGGSQRFSPGEWKMTGAKGADIRNAIVPMTFPGPDQTLFQLLGLLIDAGREVASVKDIMTGDNGGKTQTATTTLALIEQGMMVFTASYKRIFRALKGEFKLLAKINATTVSKEEYNAFHDYVDAQTGQPAMLDPAQEYAAADMDIVPVADPSSVTKMQEAAKAQIIMQLAEQGMVDKGEAAKRVLSAASLSDTDALMPKPDPMAQQVAQFQQAMAEADLTMKQIEVQKKLAEIDKLRAETMTEGVDAAATAAGVQLDQMKMQLEAIRDGIAGLIGQGFGRVAQPSGFGAGPVGGQGLDQGAGGYGDAGLLGGAAMAGAGQIGPYQG